MNSLRKDCISSLKRYSFGCLIAILLVNRKNTYPSCGRMSDSGDQPVKLIFHCIVLINRYNSPAMFCVLSGARNTNSECPRHIRNTRGRSAEKCMTIQMQSNYNERSARPARTWGEVTSSFLKQRAVAPRQLTVMRS